MLNKYARAFFTRLFTPLANALLRAGVGPDAVTIIGTIGVCFGALFFFPRGQLFAGVMVITAFVFSDTLDGIMARAKGRKGPWGAYLDSTLDRFADAAVFGGLVIYFARQEQYLIAELALLCLVLGSLVSYARARAEGLGMSGAGGIAERADRLVAVLVATGFVGLGVPEVVLTVTLVVLALASAFTVGQRIVGVRRQSRELERGLENE